MNRGAEKRDRERERIGRLIKNKTKTRIEQTGVKK